MTGPARGGGAYSGSGVVIGKQGNQYSVLTCAHGVDYPQCSIVFTNGYAIQARFSVVLKEEDVAIATFQSQHQLTVFKTKSTVDPSKPVDIVGFPGGRQYRHRRASVMSTTGWQDSQGRPLLQLSGTPQQGESGGPIIQDGFVVGVLSAGSVGETFASSPQLTHQIVTLNVASDDSIDNIAGEPKTPEVAQGQTPPTGTTEPIVIHGQDGQKGADGADGRDGRGIAEVRIQDGSLLVKLDDGTEQNAGSIKTDLDAIVLTIDTMRRSNAQQFEEIQNTLANMRRENSGRPDADRTGSGAGGAEDPAARGATAATDNRSADRSSAFENLILYYTSRECERCRECDERINQLKAGGWPVIVTRLAPRDAQVDGVPRMLMPFKRRHVVGEENCLRYLESL